MEQQNNNKQKDGDSPLDEVFTSPPPPPAVTTEKSVTFISKENSRSGTPQPNAITTPTVEGSLPAFAASSVSPHGSDQFNPEVSNKNRVFKKNPFKSYPEDEPPQQKYFDATCQTEIRLGEWLLRDASVSRSAYLEVQEQLRGERIKFLKEASLIRQNLAKLESQINRAQHASQASHGLGKSYRGGGNANATTTLSGASRLGATTTTGGGVGSGEYVAGGGTSTVKFLSPTSSSPSPAEQNQNQFLSAIAGNPALNISRESHQSNLLDVSMQLGRTSQNLDQTATMMMTSNNISPTRFGATASNVSPTLHQQQQQQNQISQQQLQANAIIQATSSNIMLLMNEAAKALSIVNTIEELEEKHSAHVTEVRTKLTDEIEELKRKHLSEIHDLESELSMLRFEAESADRAAVLEKERLVHSMERTTWDSVQSFKTQLKQYENDLEHQQKTTQELSEENEKLKKELQQMKAEQILLVSENRRLVAV